MIHSKSEVHETAQLGQNVTVWQFASILADCVIGDDVSIGACAEIGRGTQVGNGTRISAHVFLPSGSQVGERVFIGPGAMFADDAHPRAGNTNYIASPPILEDGCSIGMGAIILPGVRIGLGALIGAGSIVTRDVAPHEHVRGEPARVKPYSRIQAETSHEVYAPSIRDRVITGERVVER
jgi:acetyltransferase-like isoleucine patch superfamily enzyme